MKVTAHPIEEIEIFDLEILTLDQYLEQNINMESFGWCNGYLIKFNYFSEEEMDKAFFNHKRIYRSVDVAPCPDYKKEIQCRFSKKTLFDYTGSHVTEAIIKYVKSLK